MAVKISQELNCIPRPTDDENLNVSVFYQSEKSHSSFLKYILFLHTPFVHLGLDLNLSNPEVRAAPPE